VGLELYAAAGVEFVHELIHEGKDVFLDLKVYDIPETVKRAVAQVARTGVKFLTAHAVGSVMRAAVEGRGHSHLKLLAVTVLTSFGPEDMAENGIRLHHRRAGGFAHAEGHGTGDGRHRGVSAGSRRRRRHHRPGKVLVTPGVRSAGAAKGDQKRTATPLEAVRDGADYLVIGRQITRAADPADEAARILDEIGVAWIA
jgi:orotidine-5'-phosphate decarboxylase